MNNHSYGYLLGRPVMILGCSLVLCCCGTIDYSKYPLSAERPMPFSLQAKWNERIGQFTYEEMVAKSGPPFFKKVAADGTFVAKWSGVSLDPYEEYISKETLVLTFDGNGVLSNWTYYR